LGLSAEELARLRDALALHMDAAGRVSLPKADKLFSRMRDEEIRRRRGSRSLSQLAAEFGLTSRQIQNICREDMSDMQGALF
jgi:Mor family transcriptional regulator